MAILAHFEGPEESRDRRGSARRALRLDIANGPRAAEGQVTIHDLSLTGALLETSAGLAVGDSFEVQLPQAGSVEARVVWNSGEFYGCQFNEPISPAVLSAALLQSPPQAADAGTRPVSTDVVAELRAITAQIERLSEDVERAVTQLADKDRRHS
jgi:hypothetical protein